jgi:hypothetical protein
MAKKNSMKKRQSRVVDAMRREQKQMEKQKLRERELKERFEEHERKSIGAQQRERRKNLKDASLKTTLLETKGGVLKRKKRRERKNQNKIVKGVRVGNATKIKKNVAYKGIVIKDAASKQAVLDMLKAEDRMM